MHVYASLYIFCRWITIKMFCGRVQWLIENIATIRRSSSIGSIGSPSRPILQGAKILVEIGKYYGKATTWVSTSCVMRINKIFGSKTFRDPLYDQCVERGEKSEKKHDQELLTHRTINQFNTNNKNYLRIILFRPKMDRTVSSFHLYARTAHTHFVEISNWAN